MKTYRFWNSSITPQAFARFEMTYVQCAEVFLVLYYLSDCVLHPEGLTKAHTLSSPLGPIFFTESNDIDNTAMIK